MYDSHVQKNVRYIISLQAGISVFGGLHTLESTWNLQVPGKTKPCFRTTIFYVACAERFEIGKNPHREISESAYNTEHGVRTLRN